MSNYMKIQCKACVENEVVVRNIVGLFASCLNPTLDELTEVKTMVSEALINAIIHGYEGNENGEISIELILEDRLLTIKIQDDGCGIDDLNKACQPLYTTKPELERSGMGITIMESLADYFDITSSLNQGTVITMNKLFRGQQ